MNRRLLLIGGSILAVGLGVGLMFGTINDSSAATVFTGDTPGIAINGYDTVAYFSQGKPVEGLETIAEEWNGVRWLFANADNKALFAADPEKYAPQYGGFCAYAVANGSKAKTEPDAFSVVDGRLFLNYNQSIRTRWDRDKSKYIKDADKNWPALAK